jgi:hypothetical protein
LGAIAITGCLAAPTQGSKTFTSRPPRTSTRCIIEPPSTCEAPCHFTLLVTYQTPSGTRGKEKLPDASQRVVRAQQFDGPVSFAMRCDEWSQTQTVRREKTERAWAAHFVPTGEGECAV